MSIPPSRVDNNDQLFKNESFASIWNMLMKEEDIAVMRCIMVIVDETVVNTMNRLASIASENKKYLLRMRTRFARSNIVGVDKNLDSE